jgi:hypothetical protein
MKALCDPQSRSARLSENGGLVFDTWDFAKFVRKVRDELTSYYQPLRGGGSKHVFSTFSSCLLCGGIMTWG